MTADDDLDAVAAELYALPPARFTAERNARAQRAAPALSRRIRALRKHTVAAYAVNLLTAAGQLGEAIELSSALREAQDDLDAAELARLAPQRRALVSALAGSAAAFAEEQDVSVSAAARDSIEKTINAAVMDATAAVAVLTARLVTGLEAGGDPVSPDAVGGSLPGASAPPAPADDLAERRARKAAERAVREAGRAASEAERRRTQIAAKRTKAQERTDHLGERIVDLRRDLDRLEHERAGAASVLEDLEREQAEADAAAKKATTAAARAQAALDDL